MLINIDASSDTADNNDAYLIEMKERSSAAVWSCDYTWERFCHIIEVWIVINSRKMYVWIY